MSRATRLPLVIAAAALPSSAFAQSAPSENQALSVNGTITIASQYRLRGISLSDENPALQATIIVTHKSGFYAGAWGSSLEGYGEFGGSQLELDFYGGWRGEVTESLTLDAGIFYFGYPGSEGIGSDLFEPYVKLIAVRGPLSVSAGAAYAWEQAALGGKDNLYLFNDNSLQIIGTPFAATAHIGRTSGGSALAAGSDYWD